MPTGSSTNCLLDELNHASLVDGCRLARARGAAVFVYPHLDLEGLETRLRAWRDLATGGAALVATDAVFSMDGDAADLPALVSLCERFDALLLVDEAHATGMLGIDGAGLAELQGVKGRIPLLMGTLGKALGSFGAYVACPAALRDHLVNTCRGFINSSCHWPLCRSGLPPAGPGIRRARRPSPHGARGPGEAAHHDRGASAGSGCSRPGGGP
jgi:7-keto-8-aminopelargonate synthetase-like enzyme